MKVTSFLNVFSRCHTSRRLNWQLKPNKSVERGRVGGMDDWGHLMTSASEMTAGNILHTPHDTSHLWVYIQWGWWTLGVSQKWEWIWAHMQYGDSSRQCDSWDLYLQLRPILEKSVFCNIYCWFFSFLVPSVHSEVMYTVLIQNHFLSFWSFFPTTKNLSCNIEVKGLLGSIQPHK